MTEEDKISGKLAKCLSNSYNENPKKINKIKIEPRKQILIGTTCGVYNDKLQLLIQSAQQDIVVYIEKEEYKINFDDKDLTTNFNFLRKFPKSIPDNKILIPLLIFEVKYKKINTHQDRHYSEIARMIKSIFPFCMYNLLLINIKMPKKENNVDRVYMASKNYDKVIYWPDYSKRNSKKYKEELLNIIYEHINYLRDEKYFRLTKLLS